MPHPLLVLASLIALLPLCCNTDSAADSSGGPQQAWVLMHDGELSLQRGGTTTPLEAAGARSFALNESAGCLILSTLDEDLSPQSWVLGPQRAAADTLFLPDKLPLALTEGYLAFSSLPDSIYEPVAELCVVNGNAREVLRERKAALLTPQTGALAAEQFCTFEWDSVDELSSMYIGPAISLHSALDGATLDHWELPLEYPPADVELLYADGQSLLVLVLMDIYYWHVLRLERDGGEARLIHTLAGQPMYDQLLPGRGDRHSHLEAREGFLEMDVISLSDGPLRLIFDVTSGELLSGLPVDNMPRNRNQPLQSPDELIPGLHLSQQIFPLQMGAEWSMPAHFDQAGRLLLLIGNEPVWHEIK